MESSEPKNASSSSCKICAENGCPNVLIYWKRLEREDGSTGWAPCENPECSIRHTHRHLDTTLNTEERLPVAGVTGKKVLEGVHQGLLSDSEITKVLLEVRDTFRKQNQLLKNPLERLGYSC